MKYFVTLSFLLLLILQWNSESVNAESVILSNGQFPVEMIANKDTAVLDGQGNIVQTIARGEKLTLRNVMDQRGVVHHNGKRAFITLTDFHYVQLVDGSKVLTYEEVAYKLQLVNLMYPKLTEIQEIGQSVEGRSLYALKLGSGEKEVLLDAAFHGREHMTTNVLMEMIESYLTAYINGTNIGKYNVKEILNDVSIVFVPMVNPDGVTLSQGGKVKTPLAKLKAMNNNANFNRWKANINGVDLNRQFDVNWHLINTTKPSFKEYKGIAPYTEPEAIAVKQLIDEGNHLVYVSYHSSGQIIYWSRAKTQFERTKKLVKGVSAITRYKMMAVTSKNEPIAASEDYFTKVKDRPAMTIEIAPFAGEASVPLKRWNDVWFRNKTVGLYVANEARNW